MLRHLRRREDQLENGGMGSKRTLLIITHGKSEKALHSRANLASDPPMS